MIAHIQGKLVEKSPTEVVIDCNGVGYHVNISLHTYGLLPTTDFVKLFTHLIIKEDSHSLYGFAEKSEKEIFKLLISVSGIGANIARTMLSSIEPKQIINAIGSGDVGTIQSIKGIGVKTAQRTIIDLKEKVLKLYDLDQVSISQSNTNKDEALSALEVLGFIRKSAEKVVEKIVATMPDATVETIIKQALKNL
ncbi:Holliday junction branch migration protein RuvA [Flavobacterium psychrophilum]|jgi:Holliday junction DNA helicase RuvA|uniref:Holliday junction branch migration complex subunit RuvA n=2 Tax=Flavobacterium psychrophilum TaxID=96345 RepID=RUVA_FLAPJ|nr:Holliday junction branch migration protein RuvA [Flavobacterium psychrophilum]A6H1G0.1 RecName: Full=Holliday junction branch migration complex subunit RuvA [Flavobacterium psychrophilum JIP02/86]AIG30867.1 ATP-dependent DNA helicase RuvA [Flavobacterium psychrophilum]AIG33140.1 ATP-dependent DNA helicase RuvA [Flavobacterium psychrophilum]AIG35297.1 ATP-dependent DNA helicase RuvA [Flavobacterium psychrophilum]AIG37660.1 ATP-dependent DNA helicase RuvA [Flavobacterium psychrophilum]AIG399